MPQQKFFLNSLTIIATILGMLVQVAPFLGVNFTENDAAIINEFADTSVTFILFVIAAIGRWRATTELRVRAQ